MSTGLSVLSVTTVDYGLTTYHYLSESSEDREDRLLHGARVTKYIPVNLFFMIETI